MADSVRVEINAAKIIGRVNQKWKNNLAAITSEIRANTNEYVRFDWGHLKQSSYSASQLNQGKIIWNTPYARRVYYTGKPRLVMNPNAALLWCEEAKRRHLKAWRKFAAGKVGGV